LPVSVTVVEALVALAKAALDVGIAIHPANTYPVFGVAVIAVGTLPLAVVAVAGVIVPLLSEPGVNV
jgi:hypothetical protein